MQLGFCGLGRMGTAMVHRLLDVGHTVTVWNRTAEKAKPFLERGAQVAKTPRELAQSAPLVLTILTDDAAVEAVYAGNDGLLSGPVAGKTFVEMSTIHPETARRVAALARERGAALIDCPVSGTVGPAREGKLLGIAGGDVEAFAEARDVLAQLCRRVDHLGPSGAGSAAKLAVNLPLAVYWAALGEALSLCSNADVDTKLLLEIMMESSGGANVLRNRAPKVLAAMRGEHPDVGFDIDGMRKDLGSMIGVGKAQGAAMTVAAQALQQYERASKAGWGGRDASALAAYCVEVTRGAAASAQ